MTTDDVRRRMAVKMASAARQLATQVPTCLNTYQPTTKLAAISTGVRAISTWIIIRRVVKAVFDRCGPGAT